MQFNDIFEKIIKIDIKQYNEKYSDIVVVNPLNKNKFLPLHQIDNIDNKVILINQEKNHADHIYWPETFS